MYCCRTLPETVNTPLFWSQQQREWLRGSTVLTLTGMLEAQIAKDWAELIAPLLAQYPNVLPAAGTVTDYVWALSNIWSRAFSYSDGVHTQLQVHTGRAVTRVLVLEPRHAQHLISLLPLVLMLVIRRNVWFQSSMQRIITLLQPGA